MYFRKIGGVILYPLVSFGNLHGMLLIFARLCVQYFIFWQYFISFWHRDIKYDIMIEMSHMESQLSIIDSPENKNYVPFYNEISTYTRSISLF